MVATKSVPDNSVSGSGPGTGQCLAVATDDRYLQGAAVTIGSFLERNPWFAGAVTIIHDGLSAEARSLLTRFPGVRFHEVREPLRTWLNSAATGQPLVKKKRHHFFALEAFNLPEFRRVLLLDSDILCTGDARALFAPTDRLLAAPDTSHYSRLARHRVTYAPQRATPESDQVFHMTFNTGVIALSPGALPSSVYEGLVARARGTDWSAVETGHTVSVVLNAHFEGLWTPLPDICNYLVAGRTPHFVRSRAPLEQAIFVHFLGRPKPWQGDTPPTGVEHRRAMELWQAAHARLTTRQDQRGP